jgi:hypothetical protein
MGRVAVLPAWSRCLKVLCFVTLIWCGAMRISSAQQPGLPLSSDDQPSIHLLMGDEVDLPGGTYALKQRTAAINFVYEQPNVFDGFGVAPFYLNEGYLGPNEPHQLKLIKPLHYRDGIGVQLDYWTPAAARCRLGGAAGPEMYFDTSATDYRSMYEDRHGGALVLSLIGQCRVTSRFALEVRANRTVAVADFNSTTILAGLSYTPQTADAASSSGNSTGSGDTSYIQMLVGKTQIDDFRAQIDAGFAEWLAYGKSLSGPFGYQVSLLGDEIHTYLKREAAAAQATARQGFAGDRVELFAALGPVLTRNDDDVNPTVNIKLDLLASIGVKVHFSARLFALLQYSRVADFSKRFDTDMVLTGFGIDLGSRSADVP